MNQRFTGTLSDGSLVTLDFGTVGQAIRASALVARRADAVSGAIAVTGTVTRPDGSTVALTGTYDPETKQFSISGGDYAFSGTYDGGAIQAAATVGGVPVKLVAVMGTSSASTRYCGTFTTAKQETGSFNIVVSGTHAFGVAEGGVAFSGTITGSAIAMKDDRGTPISATVSNGAVNGTFTNGDGLGTFSGSTAACDAILTPPEAPACVYTYSDWGACQPDQTQTRTVVSATPEGCTGTPVLTQSCTAAPPPSACEVTVSNPAPVIYKTLSTTATAPAAAGGTIVDGTYYRTAQTRFGQATDGSDKDSGTSQLRIEIAGTGIDVLITEGGVTNRFQGTVTTSGAELTITVTCSTDAVNQPVGSTMSLGYTATATALKIYDASENSEEVFALQGVQPPPALECAAPATNPASPSTEKDSTTASGPPPAGGTVSPGTYDLWNTVYYAQSADTSMSPSTDRRRFILSADGTIEVIVSDGTSVGRFLGTYVVETANKTLTITVTCSSDPAAQAVGSVLGPIPYTVDTWSVQGATLLKLYTTSHTGLPKEEAYKLQ